MSKEDKFLQPSSPGIEELFAEEVPLPDVSTQNRVIPNDFIRSSLFTVTNKKIKREYIKEKELFTFGNTKITFTGEELRQDDEDVWLQIVFSACRTNRTTIEFSPYTFLRELDYPARTQYRDSMKTSISRMTATNIRITNVNLKKGLAFSLIRKFAWQDDSGDKLKKWKIWLEPELLKLLDNLQFSKIHWDQRKKLNPLAKWLHSYYSSHAEPFPIKVETLHKACGSKSKQLKHFKENLRKALMELVQVGFLETFFVDARNLTHVIRVKKNTYFYKSESE